MLQTHLEVWGDQNREREGFCEGSKLSFRSGLVFFLFKTCTSQEDFDNFSVRACFVPNAFSNYILYLQAIKFINIVHVRHGLRNLKTGSFLSREFPKITVTKVQLR